MKLGTGEEKLVPIDGAKKDPFKHCLLMKQEIQNATAVLGFQVRFHTCGWGIGVEVSVEVDIRLG